MRNEVRSVSSETDPEFTAGSTATDGADRPYIEVRLAGFRTAVAGSSAGTHRSHRFARASHTTRDDAANSVLLPCTGRRGLNDATQAALPFCCLIKASARFANSCGVTSSLCVAINQLLPDGSFTLPLRSP